MVRAHLQFDMLVLLKLESWFAGHWFIFNDVSEDSKLKDQVLKLVFKDKDLHPALVWSLQSICIVQRSLACSSSQLSVGRLVVLDSEAVG